MCSLVRVGREVEVKTRIWRGGGNITSFAIKNPPTYTKCMCLIVQLR